MTYLARRHPWGRQDAVVRSEIYTVVDRDYRVNVYSTLSIMWDKLSNHLYLDRYGEEKLTKDALRHKLELEGSVMLYERDARSNGDWVLQIEHHK